jgi:hypothetical protein
VKYRAIAPVTLPVGAVVKMVTPEQAHRRRHLVKPGQDGWCTVTAEFQFKAGEEFETEHGMSKATVVALDEPAPAVAAHAPAPAAPAAPEAPAPAKAAAQAKPAPKR